MKSLSNRAILSRLVSIGFSSPIGHAHIFRVIITLYYLLIIIEGDDLSERYDYLKEYLVHQEVKQALNSIFEWRILQPGRVIITPEGKASPFKDHRPTSTLLWPKGSKPQRTNSILTDPYFSLRNFPLFLKNLTSLQLTLEDIGWIFITHPHGDHFLSIPDQQYRQFYPRLTLNEITLIKGLSNSALPGHHPHQQALVFNSYRNLSTWIVGDAILNEEWLRAWAYYYPNGYNREEIIQTWESVAKIIRNADIIIPGHGDPIQVTADLIEDLLKSFSKAPYSEDAPSVMFMLTEKLSILKKQSNVAFRKCSMEDII